MTLTASIDKPNPHPGDQLTLTVTSDTRLHQVSESLVIDGQPPIAMTGSFVDPETVSDPGTTWTTVSDDGTTGVYRATAPQLLGAHTVVVAADGVAVSVLYTVTAPTAPILFGADAANAAGFDAAAKVLGPIALRRLFYSGQLPASYSALNLPVGVNAVVSFKTPGANDIPFAQSCPAGTRVIFHHEPEDADDTYGGDGTKFVAAYTPVYDKLKAANPQLLVGMAAMTFQYNPNNAPIQQQGVDGSFIPPADKVDFYSADNYQNKPSGKGLVNDPAWLGWYKLVKDKGKPLALAEYGMGVNPVGYTVDAWAAQRAASIKADAVYLRTLPGFQLPGAFWLYWYNTGAQGDWRFTDPGCAAAWQAAQVG